MSASCSEGCLLPFNFLYQILRLVVQADQMTAKMRSHRYSEQEEVCFCRKRENSSLKAVGHLQDEIHAD